MRFTLPALVLVAVLAAFGCVRATPAAAVAEEPVASAPTEDEPAAAPAPAFADVQPIVERCRPCHFPGGKKYEDLPFDRPETLDALGEKLFTRIKDEDEQALLRAFLARKKSAG